MDIVGIKVRTGKLQHLKEGAVYSVSDDTAKLLIEKGFAKLKDDKGTSTPKPKRTTKKATKKAE